MCPSDVAGVDLFVGKLQSASRTQSGTGATEKFVVCEISSNDGKSNPNSTKTRLLQILDPMKNFITGLHSEQRNVNEHAAEPSF